MMMSDQRLPFVPENVPRFSGKLLSWLGLNLLKLLGWRIHGDIPNVPKLVLAVAPHTSNWDFIIAMCGMAALRIKLSFLMKKEAFFWPLGRFFIRLGGIPLDRRAAQDTVAQVGAWFEQNERVWVAITPEGTRAKVEKWKTGFLRIAHSMHVPVLLVAWDYPTKTIYIDGFWASSGDHVADAEKVQAYMCKKYQGRHPERQ